MPVKMMAFLKAREGISRAAFITHYETHHVPLVRSIMPGIIEYRRNFLPDAVTELRCGDGNVVCGPGSF